MLMSARRSRVCVRADGWGWATSWLPFLSKEGGVKRSVVEPLLVLAQHGAAGVVEADAASRNRTRPDFPDLPGGDDTARVGTPSGAGEVDRARRRSSGADWGSGRPAIRVPGQKGVCCW